MSLQNAWSVEGARGHLAPSMRVNIQEVEVLWAKTHRLQHLATHHLAVGFEDCHMLHMLSIAGVHIGVRACYQGDALLMFKVPFNEI